MRRAFEHRGEAKEFAVARLVDEHLLVIFVDGGDLDFAADHDVGVALGVADLVDALVRNEFFHFDLRSEHRGLFIVE